MKLFIWTDEHSYTAFAHCDTVAEARNLLRPQIGGYDGSCPERAKARKDVDEFTPAVYNGRVADFRLSASAEEREAMERAYKLSRDVTDLRAQLKASQADVKLLREAAQTFIDKMRKVEDSPEYYAVWVTAQLHNGQYTGPTWQIEFEDLCAAIAARRKAEKEGKE